MKIGDEVTYNGSEFKFLKGCRVKIIAVFKPDPDALDPDEKLFIRDNRTLAWMGGVHPSDRVEVTPWIEEEGRFSFVSSDPLAADLAG